MFFYMNIQSRANIDIRLKKRVKRSSFLIYIIYLHLSSEPFPFEIIPPLNFMVKILKGLAIHCVERVHIRSYSGSYFPTYGLNIERYSLSLHIQSECRKIRTRNNLEYGHFLRSAFYLTLEYQFSL